MWMQCYFPTKFLQRLNQHDLFFRIQYFDVTYDISLATMLHSWRSTRLCKMIRLRSTKHIKYNFISMIQRNVQRYKNCETTTRDSSSVRILVLLIRVKDLCYYTYKSYCYWSSRGLSLLPEVKSHPSLQQKTQEHYNHEKGKRDSVICLCEKVR